MPGQNTDIPLLDELFSLANSEYTPSREGFTFGNANAGVPDSFSLNVVPDIQEQMALSELRNLTVQPGLFNPTPTDASDDPQQPMPVVGRDIDPSYILKIMKANESSGDYAAVNPHSTASGAYQYTDGTWNGYGGYSRALFAPPKIQDKRFKEDLMAAVNEYKGNPFKVIASHYLPAYADDPEIWDKSLEIYGNKVSPINKYIQRTVEGTKLEKPFEQFIANQQ